MAIHVISRLLNPKNVKKTNFQNSLRLALQNKQIHCQINRGDRREGTENKRNLEEISLSVPL